MNLDIIIKICGVLGLVISLTTFILTRYEKRRKIEIELFSSSIDDFESNESLIPILVYSKISDSILKIRLTNICQHSIILKPKTLIIKNGKYSYNLGEHDFLGIDTFKELMPPTSVREIGIFSEGLKSSLNIKVSKHYSEAEIYNLKVTIADHVGRKFNSNMYTYYEDTDRYVKK